MTSTPEAVPATRVPPPVVELRGAIAGDLATYVRDKILRALDRGVRPIGPARVRVVRHDDPARERPVVAAAHVDVARRRLHVHAVAEEPREAVDLLIDRLARQIGDAHSRRQHHHRGGAPDAGDPDTAIGRHDVVQAVPTSAADAAAIMEDRSEAFHLFVERTTGRRAVVYCAGPTGRRLAVDDGSGPAAATPDVTTSPHAARSLTPERAVEHLRLADMPFLFFHDTEADRARVVHLDHRGRGVLVDVETGADGDAEIGGDVSWSSP
ncbi:HPF/RaiA family ribosome-associated protein [Actinomycetospora sp. C-140]